MKSLQHRMSFSVQYVKPWKKKDIPMASAEVTMIPQTYVSLTEDARPDKYPENPRSSWTKMMMYRKYITTGRNKTDTCIYQRQ